METSDPKYKHKPSEKHTLEEVLKSLQDLIRNDLAEGAAAAAKPGSAPAESRQQADGSPAAAEARPRRDNASNTREDFAPVAPGSGPVNLDAVLRSLKDLVGNELNVGDTPKPPETKPAETHAEYLATGEKIEEYIPEELGRLGDELDIAAEPVLDQPEPAPLRDASPAPEAVIEQTLPQEFAPLDEDLTLEELAEAASTPAESFGPEEIIEQTLPQGFTPLDEELTLEELAEAVSPTPDLAEEISIDETLPPGFVSLEEGLTLETPAEMAPSAPVVSEMPELPGEISPELAAEPELQPPAPAIPPAADGGVAPGAQQELFLEEPPPIELRMPPSEVITAPAAEPAPQPESPMTPAAGAAEMETDKRDTAQALPTIDVEESFGARNDIDTAGPASEELIVLDAEISGTPEATPVAAAPPPAAPAEKKITLAIVSGPLLDDPQSKPSVDFATHGLEPPPPAVPATPAPEDELPVIAVEPDLSPAPDTPKATETAPAPEIRTETMPAGKSPVTPAEPPATTPPPAFSLDDIPVLNEVVAPPAGSVPAAKPDAPPSTLPAPDRARDLVVRAVAKLNVEMRKSGGAGLDTKTILRLQQLIRQELEKSGEK